MIMKQEEQTKKNEINSNKVNKSYFLNSDIVYRHTNNTLIGPKYVFTSVRVPQIKSV